MEEGALIFTSVRRDWHCLFLMMFLWPCFSSRSELCGMKTSHLGVSYI